MQESEEEDDDEDEKIYDEDPQPYEGDQEIEPIDQSEAVVVVEPDPVMPHLPPIPKDTIILLVGNKKKRKFGDVHGTQGNEGPSAPKRRHGMEPKEKSLWVFPRQ